MARPKHIIEYAALRTFMFAFRVLPLHLSLLVAAILAWIGFHLVRFRRAEADERIAQILPALSPRERKRIAWVGFRNLFFNVVDQTRVSVITPEWVLKNMECKETLEYLKETLAEGEGAVMALVHTGSWEMLGVAAKQYDFEMFYISRAQKNPLVNKFMFGSREKRGVTTIDRDDPMLLRACVRNLKAGMHLGILVDVRSKTEGAQYNFLEHDAWLAPGAAVIARMAKAKVIPFFLTRVGWSQHKITALPHIQPDPKADRETEINRVMQQILDGMSALILENPEQYFWVNKRWVLDPFKDETIPETDADVPSDESPPAS